MRKPNTQELKDEYKKAVILEIIAGGIFLFGLMMYFQPPGEEFFTLYIRFPVVAINFAPGLQMAVGAFLWAMGESTRRDIARKLLVERQDAAALRKQAIARHLTMTLGYAGVLILIVIAMALDFLDKGLIFKNILMFTIVGLTVGVKFMLHLGQHPSNQ